jgi:predicted RNA-binding protein with PUA-like domain
LAEIKADSRLQQIGLVRQGRLSVQGLLAEEFDAILDLSATKK